MTASAPVAEYPLYFRDGTGFVWSNRPRSYAPDHIPDDLLPQAGYQSDSTVSAPGRIS